MQKMKPWMKAGAGLGLLTLHPTQYVEAKNNPQEASPNIVFILADDMGYGDLGCYGNQVIQTPVIDGLAEEGLRFTQFYAGASVSSPSRACLMTGLHTGHARIRGNMCRAGGIEGTREGMVGTVRRTSLQPEDVTIAAALKEKDYYSCLVNKWHLDGFDTAAGPLDRGFDEFYGWTIHEPRSHNFYPDVRWRNRERYEIPLNQDGSRADHNTDRSTEEALDFLKRAAQKDQPFYLYLAYNAPHVPLDAKETHLYDDSGLPENDRRYASLISHMDACIGQVLSTLDSLGLTQETIVVFASDNGGAKAAQVEQLNVNGGLRGWKGELYEGGIRVPVIVRWPGFVKPGTTSHVPAYFPDFFNTFLDVADLEHAYTEDGVSLLPVLLKGKKSLGNRFLYWEQFPRTGISQAVRYGKWKAIRLQTDQDWVLYDLESDPKERHNVAKNHLRILKRIERFIASNRTESENWPIE